jgi:hypothetical protein
MNLKTLWQTKYIVPSLVLLTVAIVIAALVSPLDKTLGERVRLVYVHGAIIRVVLATFVLAGVLGAVFVVTRRAGALAWASALFEGSLVLWVVYLGISVVTTLETWGGIPWFEPRWVFTLQLTGLAPLLYAAGRLLKNPRLTAVLYAIFPMIMLWLLSQARLVLHPIDPIGESGEASIQLAYGVMLALWAAVGVQVVRGVKALADRRAARAPRPAPIG